MDFLNFLELALRTPTGKPWQVNIDGFFCQLGGGASIHIITGDGREIHYSIRLLFMTNNNEAEYEVLLAGLAMVEPIIKSKGNQCAS